MGNLYMMTTIADRRIAPSYVGLYKENDINVMFLSLGYGTVTNERMDCLGIESREKTVVTSIIEEEKWIDIKRQLEKQLQIDVPGGGIAFTIPLSSIGGRKALQFLIENDQYQRQEESTLKDTVHDLIVVISEIGYTNLIMEAARKAGAYGGTVIHAKGTGMEEAEKFMGATLAAEKEITYIIVKNQQKNPIMQAIMKEAGLNTKAKAICFSLPVTDTAGLRLMED